MTDSNPYQSPSQTELKVHYSDDELLTHSEKSFIFIGKVLAVLSGMVAGLGAGFLVWFVFSYVGFSFLGDVVARWGEVAVVAVAALTVSGLVSYYQFRRVMRYRQRILDSDSYANRREMVAMLEAAKREKLDSLDAKDD